MIHLVSILSVFSIRSESKVQFLFFTTDSRLESEFFRYSLCKLDGFYVHFSSLKSVAFLFNLHIKETAKF